MNEPNHLHRRDFVKTAAATGAALGAAGILPAVHAQGDDTIKVALVGCGGRGTGALGNCLKAGEHLGLKMKVVATADAFKEKASNVGSKHGVPPEQCFGGYDGYKKVMDTDAHVVLMATPPLFRPAHFAAAIAKGKHVFMEKPVAVDPVGARQVIELGAVAEKAGLSVVAGTQRRHEKNYRRNVAAVRAGAIGAIKGGIINWNGGALWYKDRNPGEDDASYMVRNWVSFMEMSGDHIVEQHVHNIDVAIWYLGRVPQSAFGGGGRARRKTGNQYDFFNVGYDFGEGVHIHSMCRQINGTFGRVNEFFTGTEGTVWGGGKLEGKTVTTPEFPEFGGPYVQEHVDLLNSLRKKGEYWNQAREVAESTLAAIMGRIACYTGQLIKWEDLVTNTNSPYYNLAVSPNVADFEAGTVKAPADNIAPLPGKA
jgi:predicted dehydrogenase